MSRGTFKGNGEDKNFPWLIQILRPSNVVRITNNKGMVFTDFLSDIKQSSDSRFIPGYRQFVLNLEKQSAIINYKGDL